MVDDLDFIEGARSQSREMWNQFPAEVVALLGECRDLLATLVAGGGSRFSVSDQDAMTAMVKHGTNMTAIAKELKVHLNTLKTSKRFAKFRAYRQDVMDRKQKEEAKGQGRARKGIANADGSVDGVTHSNQEDTDECLDATERRERAQSRSRKTDGSK